ncbi:hypothetical protein RHO92_25575, partial [Salmonella enterica subsp. enterica serovar Typhimurium]|nr:hypothetical protein [Salmonella enterica subsp. enterica serovar Typhimurium]
GGNQNTCNAIGSKKRNLPLNKSPTIREININIYIKINLGIRWLEGNETDALHLTHVVESNNSDECIWVLLLALLYFFQHL